MEKLAHRHEILRRLSLEQFNAVQDNAKIEELTDAELGFCLELTPNQIVNFLSVRTAESEKIGIKPATDAKNEKMRLGYIVGSLLLTALSLSLGFGNSVVVYFALINAMVAIGIALYHLTDKFYSPEYDSETEISNGNVAVALSKLATVILICVCIATGANSITGLFRDGEAEPTVGTGVSKARIAPQPETPRENTERNPFIGDSGTTER